jgi:hypothetical protein
VPTAKSAKQKRKRCQNCNKLFVPARNVPDQKFCKDKCRREFWTHGSAFGPMKAGLYSAIDKKYVSLKKEWRTEIKDQSRRIDRAEALLLKLQTAHEEHTHRQTGMRGGDPADDYTDIPKDVEESRRKRTVERCLSDARSR